MPKPLHIIAGCVLSLVAWTVFASFIYCLGFAHFNPSLAFARFQPPYYQWFQVAWYWLTRDTSERVQFWLIVSGAVPTIAALLGTFAAMRNEASQQPPRWRRPWEDDSRRIPPNAA